MCLGFSINQKPNYLDRLVCIRELPRQQEKLVIGFMRSISAKDWRRKPWAHLLKLDLKSNSYRTLKFIVRAKICVVSAYRKSLDINCSQSLNNLQGMISISQQIKRYGSC